MRLGFALLVLVLLIVTGWAIFRDAFPEWRGYQRELIERESTRLERELAAARAELDRPGIRAELARIEARLRAVNSDSGEVGYRLAEIRDRLEIAQAAIDSTRRELREAERRQREAADSGVRKELVAELERVQQAYAVATGTWPPDTVHVGRLWAVRDSLADRLLEEEGPVMLLRERLRERENEARALRREAVALSAGRDSLEAERNRLLAPVTNREAALARLRNRSLRVREIVSPDGRELARCPTCHGTLEDPPGAHPPLPAQAAFRDVPCTVCHRGRGRALDVEGAHEGLLTAAGPRSLRGRIERLLSPDPAEREAAREELRRLTGEDPAEERAEGSAPGDADSAVARAWAQWWDKAEAYFEPVLTSEDGVPESPLETGGVDSWIFSVRGRPLRYVGSQKCLACHEVLHREHSRRWLETKFRSIERLLDEADPTPCFPCHTTGWDSTAGTYAEPGVTCEGCHGPGERYNEMMFVGQELVAQGQEVGGQALLNESSRLAREAVSRRLIHGDAGETNLCVTCHHPRRHRDAGPGFLERPPMGPGAAREEVIGTDAG